MAEDKELKQAQLVFQSLCEMLDGREWPYEKDEKEFVIACGARGDDLPIGIIIRVDRKRRIVSLISQMPFPVPENRRTAMAIAVSQASSELVDGNFEFNYMTGDIFFRMTSSYFDSLIGKDMFEYMLACACYTIDEYNDKFEVIAKQDMSAEEIVQFIRGDK